VTLNTSFSRVYHACTSTFVFNQHMKFKVSSFTNSKDMIASKIL